MASSTSSSGGPRGHYDDEPGGQVVGAVSASTAVTWWLARVGVGIGTAAVAASLLGLSAGRTATVAVVGLVASVATVGPSDATTTVVDRGLLAVDKHLKADAPPAFGQLAVVMYFDKSGATTSDGGGAPSLAAIREVLRAACAKYARLRAERRPPGRMIDEGFVVGDSFDADARCAEESVSPDGLADRIEALANTDAAALWRVDVLRTTETTNDLPRQRDAVVCRLHHAVADGLRAVKLAGDVLRFEDGSRATVDALHKVGASVSAAAPRAATRSNNNNLMVVLFDRIVRTAGIALTWAADLGRAAVLADAMPDETRPVGHRAGAPLAPSPRRHVARRVATLDALRSLRAAQALPTSAGSSSARTPPKPTLNDVILTAFCGALDDKSVDAHDGPKSTTTRTFVAAALPEAVRDDARLYNRFVMPSLDLPRGALIGSRADRLDRVREAMARLKRSRVAHCVAGLSAVLERLRCVDAVLFQTQRRLFGKHSFVYSNVPGFERPVYLAGRRVADFAVFFPNLLTQTIFLTYDGHLVMSVSGTSGKCENGDAAPVVDPDALVDAVAREFQGWEQEVAAR